MFEPNDETVYVDVNTDDLDEFSNLLNGKAQVKQEDTSVETDSDETPESKEEVENTEELEVSNKDEETEEESTEEKPKKVNKVQERINKVLEKERLQRERADEAERKIAELQKTLESKTEKAVTVVTNGAPTPDDLNEDGTDKYPLGEFDPSYIRDLTRHTIQTEQAIIKEQEAKEQAERQEREARAALDAQWRERLDTVTEQYEDFSEKTLELEEAFDGIDERYGDYLVQTIKSLDHGPEVLYYFANNLDEAKKFVRMGPLAATLALGEYNAMFKGQTRKEAKVSNAPPPPQVNKGSKTRVAVSGDTDDLDAFSKVFFQRK